MQHKGVGFSEGNGLDLIFRCDLFQLFHARYGRQDRLLEISLVLLCDKIQRFQHGLFTPRQQDLLRRRVTTQRRTQIAPNTAYRLANQSKVPYSSQPRGSSTSQQANCSVLAPQLHPLESKQTPRQLYPTSYLDGLRGVAALFVVIHHYALSFTSCSMKGWHGGEEDGEEGTHEWLFQLPMIRVVHSGRFMVVIFFVISGYVLSYRSLKLARERKSVELLDSLASSVFRRWLRLHLPVIASTFIAFLMARAGFWTYLEAGWENSPTGTYLAPVPVPLPVPGGTFTEQLWDWFADAQQLCDPFRYGVVGGSKYNINVLWTIPVEWMGSMVVFTIVLGLARTHTWVKLTVLCYLCYWCHNIARWAPATFISGILIAELSFVRAQYKDSASLVVLGQTLTNNTNLSKCLEWGSRIFWTLVFLFGLYIGSQPQEDASSTPGYRTLTSLVPEQYYDNDGIFGLAIGGPIVVFALDNARFLQSIFTTPIAQYLGDISFSLYMMHNQVLFTLGQWLVPKLMHLTGGWANGQSGFFGALALALCITMPVTFWVSDVFSRGVDERCVRFARWMSGKCFVAL